MKVLHTIGFLLLTTLVFGQKSTLLQNVNVRAKELKHSLNKTGDSLILEGERTIYRVDIFNDDFEQSLMVKNSKVIIPLNDIPVGRFVIEAAMPDRLIVMTLLRNESRGSSINIPQLPRKTSLFGDEPATVAKTTISNTNEVKDIEVATIDTKETVNEEKVAISIKKPTIVKKKTTIVTKKITPKKIAATVKKPIVIDEKIASVKNIQQNTAHKIVQAYWIIYKMNKGNSSRKVMRFGDQALVDKMIAHNNLDKKTNTGKRNELTIWEVYDVAKFASYKMKKANKLTSEHDFFNVEPYFKAENELTTTP